MNCPRSERAIGGDESRWHWFLAFGVAKLAKTWHLQDHVRFAKLKFRPGDENVNLHHQATCKLVFPKQIYSGD
jgi:hypothetical protein